MASLYLGYNRFLNDLFTLHDIYEYIYNMNFHIHRGSFWAYKWSHHSLKYKEKNSTQRDMVGEKKNHQIQLKLYPDDKHD